MSETSTSTKGLSLTVIILTRDEARHIDRCIASIREIATEILVVDSGSRDFTVEHATAAGARVIHNPWTNYATQFNWGIGQVDPGCRWIMRLDADEVVQPDLIRQIQDQVPGLTHAVTGVFVGRRMCFLGGPIRWGGVFPVRVLRLIRNGQGHCENRWMDEHLITNGETVNLSGEIIDDNLKPLTWWTEKHNGYASREAVDLLNLEYGFMPHESVADLRGGQQAGVKRWLKERVYARLPGGFRALAYFCYRYLIRLGFLDGREGTAFHVLQGFWYRYLVDTKLYEVKQHMRRHGVDVVTAIDQVLGIKVR